MPQPRKLYLGPFQPTLESALADEIAAYKKTKGSLAPLTVVVPTHLLGLHLRRQLAPHANINFEILDALLAAPAAPRLGLELLCRRIAKSCDDYFAPVNDTTGFAVALLETFKDLEQAGITKFTGKTKKLRELATAYKVYRQWLADHGFLKFKIANLKSPTFLYGFYDLTTVQKKFVEHLGPSAVFFPAVEHSDFSRPLLDWFGGHAKTLRRSHTPTILSCPGEPSEVREALRAALAHVRETSKTFADMAILCRSREQYDAILRDVLLGTGVRAFFRGGRPLSENPDSQLLLLLLEVVRSDYSRAAVMELACHIGPYSRWDARTVELGIVAGKTQWQRAARDRELAEFVARLFTALDKIPQTGKWIDFTTPVLAGFRALGGSHDGVIEAVTALVELDAFESPVGFETFVEFCRKALNAGSEQTEKFQGGGLFVSDVMGARGLSFSFVAVLGMFEKSFPRVVREDPLLLDEERKLISPDLPLKRRGHDEERLLFDLACGTARNKLVLTFPRLEAGTGRPRVQSSFLAGEPRVVPLQPFSTDDPLDERECNLSMLSAKPALPRALAADISPHLAAGLEAERQRWGEVTLTAYDGLVPAAGGIPDASPTQLETFAFCPFKYFNRHVLGVERWEEPDQLWVADPREIGTLAHRILERVFSEGATLEVVAREELERFEREEVTGLPVVWAWRRAVLLRDLARLIAQERRGEFVPAKFEYRVKDEVGGLRFSGRIDRVDTNGQQARIVDYKTGKPYHTKNDAFEGGEALQLPLYMLAAAKVLGLRVVSAEYAYLAGRRVNFSETALQDRQAELTRILKTLAGMLGKGVFAQHTGHGKCGWCDYRLICGNAVEALAERKRDDPRLKDFLDVKDIE